MNKIPAKVLGQKLKKAREEKGMSCSRLAIQTGMAIRTIKRWEDVSFQGDMDKLAKIHKVLGIPLWELLPTEEELLPEEEEESLPEEELNDDQIAEAIGQRFTAKLEEQELSVIDMGRETGITPTTYRRWKVRYSGGLDDLATLHESLGIPLWELVPGWKKARRRKWEKPTSKQPSEVVAGRIRQALAEQGLSLKEFSRMTGYPRCVVTEYTRRCTCRMGRLAEIHRVLGLLLWELLPTEEELR